MATYDIQSGGVSYRVEADNEAAAQNAVAQDQSSRSMAWLMIWVVLVLPKLCATFFGWLFALLFKLGIVGKIIQTAIVAVGGVVLDLLLFGAFLGVGSSFLTEIINAIVLFVPAGLLAAWYWKWHYDTVKFMSTSAFSRLLTICFCICFYGFIGVMILGAMMGLGNTAMFVIGIDVPFAAALVYWFINTKPYYRPKPDIAGWTSAAEMGDAVAQYNLAIAYDEGWGVSENKAQSVEWYQKAAENGIAEAQYALGQIYSEKYAADFGITADFDKCLYWVKKAEDQGHKGAKKELDEARKELRESLANGSDAEKETAKEMLAQLG
ncbi:hypothetical protein FACS1894103_1260 [Campylobacterota bacterium]|nr:hypothetical protein FACS1894103_1260 [Campylobacterota bacterium]